MTSSSEPPAASFRTVLEGSAKGTATGIEVPAEVVEQLGQGKRPAVQVTLNGYRYRTTIGVMGGRHLVPVSADVRGRAGVAAGDEVEVVLTADTSPREVQVPAELAAALAQQPAAQAFFDRLSNSLQRYHADQVASAKSEETRARRVQKAVELFLAGKQR